MCSSSSSLAFLISPRYISLTYSLTHSSPCSYFSLTHSPSSVTLTSLSFLSHSLPLSLTHSSLCHSPSLEFLNPPFPSRSTLSRTRRCQPGGHYSVGGDAFAPHVWPGTRGPRCRTRSAPRTGRLSKLRSTDTNHTPPQMPNDKKILRVYVVLYQEESKRDGYRERERER